MLKTQAKTIKKNNVYHKLLSDNILSDKTLALQKPEGFRAKASRVTCLCNIRENPIRAYWR